MVFAAARSVFGRPLAARFDNEFISQVQKEFDDKGWRFIAFVRLNPVFPTRPLNYILGLTGIAFFTYVWATFVFLLPPSNRRGFYRQPARAIRRRGPDGQLRDVDAHHLCRRYGFGGTCLRRLPVEALAAEQVIAELHRENYFYVTAPRPAYSDEHKGEPFRGIANNHRSAFSGRPGEYYDRPICSPLFLLADTLR